MRFAPLLVFALVAAACSSAASTMSTTSVTLPPPSSGLAGVQQFTVTDRSHITGHFDYPQTPPVGGPHDQTWLNCGAYASPVPNENAVHSLEHGAVWITYDPAVVKDPTPLYGLLDRGASPHVIVSPYPGLPAPVVASAWGVQMKSPSPTDPALAQFVARYKARPDGPEPGATCSGGLGTPLNRS